MSLAQTQPNQITEREQRIEVLSLVCVGVVGVAVVFYMPLLVSALIVQRGFTEQQAGFLAFAEVGAISVSAISGVYWLTRWNWRKLAFYAALALMLANAMSIVSSTTGVFSVFRIACGCAGGLLVSLAYGALSRTKNADRNFGLFSMGQLLFTSVALVSFPHVIERLGLDAVFIIIALLSAGVACLSRFIPTGLSQQKSARDNASDIPENSGKRLRYCGMVLLAVFLLFSAQGSIWVYSGQIGTVGGLSLEWAGYGLTLAALSGAAGAGLVAWVNNRFGRTIPVLIFASLNLLALSPFHGDMFFLKFVLLVCTLKFCWNYIIPVQLGFLSELDSTGRFVISSACITGLGLSFGYVLAAMLIGYGEYGYLNLLSAALLLLSLVVFLTVVRATQAQRITQ